MSFDYSYLKDRTKEKGIAQKQIAQHINITEGQFSKKLSGEYFFKQTEIVGICEILDIEAIEIGKYFFTEKVEKSQQYTEIRVNNNGSE